MSLFGAFERYFLWHLVLLDDQRCSIATINISSGIIWSLHLIVFCKSMLPTVLFNALIANNVEQAMILGR